MKDAITASADLDKLNDIIVPPAISWWPLAEGWYILLGLAVSFFIPWLIQYYYRYKADAYRRSALLELERISAINDITLKQSRLFQLLKRTALSVYPRQQVAALSGTKWWEFLAQHSRVRFTAVPLERYSQILYYPDSFDSSAAQQQFVTQFASEVKQWIRTHKRV